MTVRRLSQSEVRLPVRVRTGKEAGQTRWVPPSLGRVLHVLKNPRYAGAYFYGRTRQKKGLGRVRAALATGAPVATLFVRSGGSE